MNSLFYPRLAANNLKKNAQIYFPYMLACIITVAMYYISYALADHTALSMIGGSQLMTLLTLGTVIVGLFSLIFLFYNNSFIIKRRKKEFGLFNILGMEKKHIAKIISLETLYIAVVSLLVGICGGVLFSKLMFLILLKLLNFEVQLGFEVSFAAIRGTLILFGVIFILILLNNLRQIHLSKPIELLKGGQMGEKEPKTKWLLILIGVVALASGYYIALTTESPLSALQLFFLAVLLVIIGTYYLFTAGSIGLLKLLRKNKRYYYKANHFTSISGLIYRMKQNAVGLANICILSTMVLVTLSTTISLYIGVEDVLETRYPRDIMISSYDVSAPNITTVRNTVAETLTKQELASKNLVDYRFLAFVAQEVGDQFLTSRADIGVESTATLRTLYFIPSEDYTRLTGESVTLADNEVLLYSNRGEYSFDTLTMLERSFTVKERLASFAGASVDALMTHYIIVRDISILEELYQAQAEINGEYGSRYSHYLAFDLDASRDKILAIHQGLRASLSSTDFSSNVESVEFSRDEFYSLYGGLFFLGIFLGSLFILGAMLIIYYKQITEGYDDRHRFEIMQKVGMSKDEVKKTIRSQVLTVFFLPLITAGIHIAFAFKFISRMLAVFSLTNVELFAWCTVGTFLVFALFYGVVYIMTARVYYRIVSQQVQK